jgi:TetR/AcrR family transcriptional regulator, repressor for uid operon
MTPEAITEKGNETRRRILDVARAAFTERGYRATSMADLIAAAGVTKGGFYFHFASKAEVAVEVVRAEQAQLAAEVLAVASEHERAGDQVVAMVRALVPAIAAVKSASGVERLCAELRGDGVDDPAVARPHDAWVATTADLFRRAQAEGDMRPDVDPVVAARFAVGAFTGLEALAAGSPVAGAGRLGMQPDEFLRLVAGAIGLRAATLA